MPDAGQTVQKPDQTFRLPARSIRVADRKRAVEDQLKTQIAAVFQRKSKDTGLFPELFCKFGNRFLLQQLQKRPGDVGNGMLKIRENRLIVFFLRTFLLDGCNGFADRCDDIRDKGRLYNIVDDAVQKGFSGKSKFWCPLRIMIFVLLYCP